MLLKMVDGGILNIKEDRDYTSGCETCDYGSSYVNYFDFELTTIEIHIEASQMYEYPLSEGDLMKIILPNVELIQKMTEIEFTEFLNCQLNNIINNVEIKVNKKLTI
jgi:hypothetical protein